jgi:hypothetical protein
VPSPWRTLLNAAITQEISLKLPEGDVRKQVMGAADRAIEEWIDDYCGTPHGWHWPGPNPGPLAAAAELMLLANVLQPGGLGERVSGIAVRVAAAALGVETR